jgi:hypothetical protein
MLCSARKHKEVVDLATLRLARMYVAMFKKSPLCEPPYRVPCAHGSAESLFHRNVSLMRFLGIFMRDSLAHGCTPL